MQSRAGSIIETLTSVVIGFVVALVAQIVIYHAKAIPVSLSDNLEITAWFTLISIARQYAVRRAFNRWGHLWRK